MKKLATPMIIIAGVALVAGCGDDDSAGSAGSSTAVVTDAGDVTDTTTSSTAAVATTASTSRSMTTGGRPTPATDQPPPAASSGGNDDERPPSDDDTRTDSSQSSPEADRPLAEPNPPEPAVCKSGPGKRVQDLGGLTIGGHRVPGGRAVGVEVDGDTVGAVDVPEQYISSQQVDLGCIVWYDAPAGCLGAVEISPVTIPGALIPGVELPDAEAGDLSVDGESTPDVPIERVHIDGVKIPQICKQTPVPEGRQRSGPAGSRLVAKVIRPALTRPALTREAAVRPAVGRDEQCGSDGCVEAIRFEPVRVAAVRAQAVRIPKTELPVYALPDLDAKVLPSETSTSFEAPADVLFDTDRWELRPDAVETLRVIGEQLRSTTGPITVEGHTDARASEEHNQELSERRAASVRDWLVQAGIDPARITTKGYGESVPVAPNDTPEHLQQNRRVVVSVATGDG